MMRKAEQGNNLPDYLRSYENSDFGMQQKVRFFYRLCQVMIVFLIFIFFYTAYIQTISLDYDEYYLPVLLAPVIMGVIVLLSMILLRRGQFMLSTHILVLMSFSAVWTVMFIDKSGVIARLDTVVLIPAIIAMLPLIVKRARFSFTVFTGTNILLLVVFLMISKDQFKVPPEYLIDFFSDTVISLVFIGIVGYNIYIINTRSLERTVNDIRERHEAEKALFESETKYRETLDLLPQAVFEADINGRLLYVNKRAFEDFGYSPEEMKRGLNMIDMIIESERDIAGRNLGRLIQNDRKEGIAYTAIRKDRTTFPVQIYSSLIKASDKITGLRGIVVDISRQLESEKALKESQQLFQTMAQHSPVGIFRTKADGSTIYVNPKWSEISGLSFEEALGSGWLTAVHPDDRERLQNLWDEDFTDRRKSISEYRFLKKDGTINWVLGNAVPEIVEGEIIGYIGTITNISDIKKAQKELSDSESRYRKDLESQVKLRTEELAEAIRKLQKSNVELLEQREKLEVALDNLHKAQSQLVQSEKMASLGIMAAGVAHEINNPLNFIQAGIFGLANYFEENLDSHLPEVSPMIDGIKEGVRRAANIVTSLNQYSRNDERPRTNCNLHNIIDNCLIILQSETKNRIEIIRDYTEKVPSFNCNEGTLHQAMLNILANAVQSIESRGTIKISTRVIDEKLEISIADSGCGIDEKNIGRIFDPFFTTKEPGEGTGLGLSITYNIIQEHNGKILCSSRKFGGTEFLITLPLNIEGG